MVRALILIRFAAARTHFSRSPSGQLGSPWPLVAFAARPGVRVAGLDVFVCCFVVCLLLRPTSERASPDRALALLPAALPAGWGGGATLAPLLLLCVCLLLTQKEAPPDDKTEAGPADEEEAAAPFFFISNKWFVVFAS